MSDPEKEDELKYMKTMFTDDLKFMHRMIKRAKKKLIEEFKNIRDRIMIAMKERYGKTAKGNEYLENLFKDELKN